jgi:hypothetical protein
VFEYISDKFNHLVNRSQKDDDKDLDTNPKGISYLEHETTYVSEPNKSYLKIKTNDNGHVKIKTMEKLPDQPWETNMEEYDDINIINAIGQSGNERKELKDEKALLSEESEERHWLSDHFDFKFNEMKNFFKHMKNNIEKEIDQSFKNFDSLENEALNVSDSSQSYYLKVETNDNGRVKVKTIQKLPNQPWETHVEEYDIGNMALNATHGEGKKEPQVSEQEDLVSKEKKPLRNPDLVTEEF